MPDFNKERSLALPLDERAYLAESIQSRVARGDATVSDDEINFALETFYDLNARTSKPPKKGSAPAAPMAVDEL